jgi:hypothetical protein
VALPDFCAAFARGAYRKEIGGYPRRFSRLSGSHRNQETPAGEGNQAIQIGEKIVALCDVGIGVIFLWWQNQPTTSGEAEIAPTV